MTTDPTESSSGYETFSLRMTRYYPALRSMAYLNGMSLADQGRVYILDGIRRVLEDPAEIERLYDAEKQRLLQAGAKMRGDTP